MNSLFYNYLCFFLQQVKKYIAAQVAAIIASQVYGQKLHIS